MDTDILEDIRKLDEYLAKDQNNEYSDSDSVHTEDLGIDEIPASKNSSSDKHDAELEALFVAYPDLREIYKNCRDNNLIFALICNRKKHKILSQMYDKLMDMLKLNQLKQSNLNSPVNSRKCGLKIKLGAPYFKDNQSYPCPPNADIVAMRNDKEAPQFAYKHITWRPDDKTKLAVAVYTEISEKRLAEISRLVQAKTSTDLLKLKNIFSNKPVIEALARNWEEDTLENVEEKIQKITSGLKSDSGCNTKVNQSGLNVDSEPSASSTTITDTSTKFTEQGGSSENPEPSTSYATNMELNTDGSNPIEFQNEVLECGKSLDIIDLDSDFPKHLTTFSPCKPRENRELIAPSTSGTTVDESKLNMDFQPSTSSAIDNNTRKFIDRSAEYSTLTASSAIIIDTSTKFTEQGGSSENPEPSTSYATNMELSTDESNPIKFQNETLKCGKSLGIIDFDSDFPIHLTTFSPCKPRENRELTAPSTSGTTVDESKLNMDFQLSTSSAIDNNTRKCIDRSAEYSAQTASSATIIDTRTKFTAQDGSSENPEPSTSYATNMEISTDGSNPIEFQNEVLECGKSLGIIDFDSDFPIHFTTFSPCKPRENRELIAPSTSGTTVDESKLNMDFQTSTSSAIDNNTRKCIDRSAEYSTLTASSAIIIDTSTKFTEQGGSSENPEPSTSYATNMELSTDGSIPIEFPNEVLECGKSLGIIDLDSDFPIHLTTFSPCKPRENRELIAPSTSKTTVDESKLNIDFQPSTSSAIDNNTRKCMDSSAEYSTLTASSAIIIDTSTKFTEQGGSSENPEPSTSYATNMELSIDGSNPIEFQNEVLECGKSLGIIDFDSDFPIHLTTFSPCKPRENRELIAPSTSGTTVDESKLNMDFQPSTSSVIDNNTRKCMDRSAEYSTLTASSAIIIDTSTKFTEQGGSSENPEPSTSYATNMEISTDGSNPIEFQNETLKCGKSLGIIDFDSDFPIHFTTFSPCKPRENRELIAPSTSGTTVDESKLNMDFQPSTSSAIDNNTRKCIDRSAEYSTQTASSATIIDTSTKFTAQGGSSENPEPSTSYATNMELSTDESNPIKFQNETLKCGKSLGIIDLDSDFPKHLTTFSPCKPLENRELIAPSTSGTTVDESKLNMDFQPSTSSAIDNNTRKFIDRSAEYSTLTASSATIIDTSTTFTEQGGSSENPEPSTSYATNMELSTDESNPIKFQNETLKCGKSLGIKDLDSDIPIPITPFSPCEPRENRELIALQENRTILQCISNWSKQNIDWYKISLAHFYGRFEDFECAALWRVFLNPSISKRPWTDLQSDTLKDLAVKHNFQNWELIAQNLNINKTAFQCCKHFHSKLAEKYDTDRWTPSEDAKLKQIVELCRYGNSISWGKVAFYFRNRSRTQIYNHYRYTLAPVKKGPFSEAEDILLLTLKNIYGKDMTTISTYFENRQIQQLRNRLGSMVGTVREWSLKDDHAILQHVHKHGDGNWKLLSDLGQNPAHLRHRYNFIKKWFDLNPVGNLAQLPRRKKDQHKLRSQTRSQITAPIVEQLTLEAKDHANKCEILNLPYIESKLKKKTEYKPKPKKVIIGRKPKSKLSIDDLLLNYFKPTHKHTGPAITDLDDHLDESVERIRFIWSQLNVNLEIPSVELLESNPKLDAYDVKVLSKLKQMPPLAKQKQLYVIPPSPETLVGYRGLWLLQPRLRSQAKGSFQGLYYADRQSPIFKRVRGYNLCKVQLEQYLSSLPDKMRQEVLEERQIFWRRFYLLFKWPYLLSILPNVPEVKKTPVIQPLESMDIGRPKGNTSKPLRTYEAKFPKKRKVIEEPPEPVNSDKLSPKDLKPVKKPKGN